jgi:uncharacterized protein (TIGR02466 family)
MQALWPTIVLLDNIQNIQNKDLLEYIMKLEYFEPPGWDSNMETSIGNNSELLSDTIFEKLAKEIQSRVESYVTEIGVSLEHNKVELVQSFFNVGKPGSFQEFHIHATHDISCVYYVDAHEKQGDLVLDRFRGPQLLRTNTPAIDYRYYLPPSTGALRVFPGNLPHQVNINRSNSNRVSISCNFNVIGKKI